MVCLFCLGQTFFPAFWLDILPGKMFSATRRSFAAAAAGHRLMGRRSFATSLAMLQRGRFEPNQWDLLVGLQLQRPPVIVPELNWLAKKVDELNRKVEVANSVYSDHEMRHFEDM